MADSKNDNKTIRDCDVLVTPGHVTGFRFKEVSKRYFKRYLFAYVASSALCGLAVFGGVPGGIKLPKSFASAMTASEAEYAKRDAEIAAAKQKAEEEKAKAEQAKAEELQKKKEDEEAKAFAKQHQQKLTEAPTPTPQTTTTPAPATPAPTPVTRPEPATPAPTPATPTKTVSHEVRDYDYSTITANFKYHAKTLHELETYIKTEEDKQDVRAGRRIQPGNMPDLFKTHPELFASLSKSYASAHRN